MIPKGCVKDANAIMAASKMACTMVTFIFSVGQVERKLTLLKLCS